MTYIRIGGSSFSDKDIFAFVIVVLVIGIASWIGYFILKSTIPSHWKNRK